ncbi:MAG: TraB/GumN family protein [Bacteroidetes bacterium]|nr:TraB/GumN family protein [Bacteroidota bacterium]MBU1717621.1 TraB/GumN family protein [Bacteroidota bacterium]
MKNLLRAFFLFLFIQIIFITALFGQNEKTILWEITGKGLTKPSYLFGTIHIQDKRVFDLGPTITEKLESCDAFSMELLMDKISKEEITEVMLMKGKSLKDLYTPEEYEELKILFKEKTGQPLMLFDQMKPFFVASQVMQASMSQDMPMALDLHLLEIAKKAGKTTLGVEQLKDQMGAVDKITLEDQAKMLLEALKDTTEQSVGFEDLLVTYLSGDVDKMVELSSDTSLPAEFNKYFLIKRNYGMAKTIAKFMKTKPTFSAIGAAHLGGKEGVLELLRKKGFTVTPVFFIRGE